MKYYCKCCESEITTKRLELPVCPICLNATILLHQPALADIRRLETEAQRLRLIEVPAWETPEQYERRTGKKWQDDWAVYALYENNDGERRWFWGGCGRERRKGENGNTRKIVCAAEAGPPPDGWEPEGGHE
jgi:hypothetical protein